MALLLVRRETCAEADAETAVNLTPFATGSTEKSPPTEPESAREASATVFTAGASKLMKTRVVGSDKGEASAPKPQLFKELATSLPPHWQVRWCHVEAALELAGERIFSYAERVFPPSAASTIQDGRVWFGKTENREILVVVLSALIPLLVLVRLARRPGDLTVAIEYPPEIQGRFNVSIRKKRGGRRQRHVVRQDKNCASSKMEHFNVSRDTHFHGLRPRRYWVTVEGVLEDPETGKELKKILEERSVCVSGGRSRQLHFDSQLKGCLIEVSVAWDKRAARDASVSLFGQPYTLRYVRSGVARIEIPLGRHRIVVGGGDRVAQVDLDVKSYRPMGIAVDLGSPERLVFKGCPLAVEPYLQGDLGSAARALEQDGQQELSHLLLASLYGETGQTTRAAEHYEAGGNCAKAAALYASLKQPMRAAELWIRTKAPEACQRAIELLEGISQQDTNYAKACLLLAEAYEFAGATEQAADKLGELLGMGETAWNREELTSRFADLLEKRGDIVEALGVLEALAVREPTTPGIETRVEELRKRIEIEKRITEPKVAEETIGVPFSENQIRLSGSRYDILEQIGRGGMGVVFKARDRKLGRLVALKQLPEKLREHPKAVELFLSEARAVAVMNHPNIVTLYDADQEGDKFFITMELLEGRSLSEILRSRGCIASRDCARVGLQVAAGLHYAHSKRIVHRDIKVANLFYTRDKVVKIMDFGIAKVIEEVRRGTTVVGGTPSYMAPEQTLGNKIDGRADLYAFGVTLFEMLTGRLPFTDGDVAYHHCHTPAPDVRTLAPDVPEAFAKLILKMMEKDPGHRPVDAAEVAKHLRFLTA